MVARRARSAFTLLEILLVLGIIVIVSAMLVPNFDNMFSGQRMNGCIDTVRGAWTTARAEAIENSRPYRFAVAGNRYRIAPDDDSYWPKAPANDNACFVMEGALPDRVRFTDKGQHSSSIDENAADGKKDSKPNWTPRAVFLPDGTARDDEEVYFQIPGTRSRTIKLRALTGTIEVITEGEEKP